MSKVEEKYGFRVGDRVVFTDDEDPDGGVYNGQTGTVCSLKEYYEEDCIGVEWDIEKCKYHDCSGSCQDHHGWWVPFTHIALVDIDIGEIKSSEFDLDVLFDKPMR